jgi:Rrf2 family protein
MLNFDKKTLHAIEAMLSIAEHSGEHPISGKEVSALHELPPRYLEQMLQRLVRGGLLRGVRGPRGGYVLAREKRRISLANIVAAIEAEKESSLTLKHPALRQWLTGLNEKQGEELQETTLQDLAQTAAPITEKTANFAI